MSFPLASVFRYERSNIQFVCRFIDFWKQDCDNEEIKRLLLSAQEVEVWRWDVMYSWVHQGRDDLPAYANDVTAWSAKAEHRSVRR